MEKRIALEKRGLPDDKVSVVKKSKGHLINPELLDDESPRFLRGKSNLFLFALRLLRFIARVSLLPFLGYLSSEGVCMLKKRHAHLRTAEPNREDAMVPLISISKSVHFGRTRLPVMGQKI